MPATRRRFLQHALVAGSLAGFLREDAFDRVQAAVRGTENRDPVDLAADENFWFNIQQAFAIDRSLINLNNGGVSPSPRVVMDAMRRRLEFANESPARNLWEFQNAQVNTVREKLARAFGCLPSEMAITRNASESLQTCIYGIDMKSGDEALTTSLDYPRMINTYKQRELREGIKLVQVQVPVPLNDHAEYVDAIRKAITPRTKVILVSHIVFLTGQINPVRDVVRLGREHDIPVIVDGAHAFAHIPFHRDDLECDYYATSLHKWMTAPHGTGFLCVREERIEALWPLMAAPSPRSNDIRKFEEIGTHPAANRLAIAEAVTLYETIGAQRKAARLRYLRDRWAQRLMQDKRVRFYAQLDPAHSCGFVTFGIEGINTHDLSKHLWDKRRIITVAVEFEDISGLRISPNVYTTLDEIDLFSRTIEEVMANGLPA